MGLESLDWEVPAVWECQIKENDTAEIIDVLTSFLDSQPGRTACTRKAATRGVAISFAPTASLACAVGRRVASVGLGSRVPRPRFGPAAGFPAAAAGKSCMD